MIYVELSDDARLFIEAKMREVDETIYNDVDFELVFNQPHIIVAVINNDGKIIAFCVILVKEEYNQMAYTWSDGSKLGKRAYLQGIDYMVDNYAPIGFAEISTKIHKVQRILKWR